MNIYNIRFRHSWFAIISFVILVAINGCSGNGKKDVAFSELSISGNLNGHEYVDLGLPSGILWATCNIGSTNPEDYGDYFAWGETTTHNWRTYRWGEDKKFTKYCNNSEYGNNGYTDNLTILEASDDVATVNWGQGWRMPTYDDFEELKNNCTSTWTTLNGVNGRIFTGLNGNSIFMPAAGFSCLLNIAEVDSMGEYLSSSLNLDNSCNVLGFSFSCGVWSTVSILRRYNGYSVRPVCVNVQE